MATDRQQQWSRAATEAARQGSPAAGLFSLLAQPNEQERADKAATSTLARLQTACEEVKLAMHDLHDRGLGIDVASLAEALEYMAEVLESERERSAS